MICPVLERDIYPGVIVPPKEVPNETNESTAEEPKD